MSRPSIPAQMGFVGSVVLDNINPTPTTSTREYLLRVTSCNISAKQDIKPEEVVDGRMDRTLYSIGPRTVDGDCDFPLVHEIVRNSSKSCGQPDGECASVAQTLWELAAMRDNQGRLKHDFDVNIRYTDNMAFKYPRCIVNTLNLNVNQGDPVKMRFGIIGAGKPQQGDIIMREPINEGGAYGDQAQRLDMLSPARVVTFNDFRIGVFCRDQGGINFNGQYIRSFDVTLNNNVERYYTLNGKLAPQDVTARKRTVEGSIKLMGFTIKTFHEFIYNNQDRNSSSCSIQFGYTFGSGNNTYFGTALHGCIFKIEEVSVSNELIETNVPFTAYGDCQNLYEAIERGACGRDVQADAGIGGLGGSTADNYFTPYRV